MLNTARIYIQGETILLPQKLHATLSDNYRYYIGCLIAIGGRDPNRRQGIRRKIKIENLNGNIIELTLCDDYSGQLMPDYQLSTSSATYYYFNPNIPEAAESRAIPYQDVQQAKTRNRFPLKMIMEQNLNSYKGVRFTAKATITGINLIRDWYYISCHQCGIAATVQGDSYTCLDHDPQPGPFFSPAADKVVDHPCTELVEKYKPADPKKIPPEILAAQGKIGVFQFHLNTLGNLRDLTLDDVFDLKSKMRSRLPVHWNQAKVIQTVDNLFSNCETYNHAVTKLQSNNVKNPEPHHQHSLCHTLSRRKHGMRQRSDCHNTRYKIEKY
ncbi:nucleic acid-binding, OB-fold protein [Tanacetum coccineum]|uniref:Nucleic acid-binding, OB-fold protein n=1 Tax=Tanacetum coccineum TaxID=301880 RepID=A0ABQ5B0Q8_9ASTR